MGFVMTKPKQKYTTFGLSFPDERVLDTAKVRAKEMGMSLSAYVNQLIRKDVGMPGSFSHEAGAKQLLKYPDIQHGMVAEDAPPKPKKKPREK